MQTTGTLLRLTLVRECRFCQSGRAATCPDTILVWRGSCTHTLTPAADLCAACDRKPCSRKQARRMECSTGPCSFRPAMSIGLRGWPPSVMLQAPRSAARISCNDVHLVSCQTLVWFYAGLTNKVHGMNPVVAGPLFGSAHAAPYYLVHSLTYLLFHLFCPLPLATALPCF